MTDPALAIAIPFVAQFERFVAAPYHGASDRPDVWSIGYGFTHLADGSPVSADTPPMTRAEADARLGELLADLLISIRRIVRVRLTDHMAAALASFAYNTGLGDLERSTLLTHKAGSPSRAAACFPAWVYANGVVVPGLVRRRAAEKALFLTGDDPVQTAPEYSQTIPGAAASAESEADRLDDQFNPEPEQAP